MLQRIFSFLLFTLLSFNPIHSQNTTKNILFVGNSMTYYNDMPVIFRDIANNKGKNVATQMHAPGGTGFINHVTNPQVYNLFKSKEWHAVILQPGTGESAGVTSSVNTTAQRGQILIDSIRKYSPCAKIMLYEIPYGVPAATDYATYFVLQTQIRDSITKMADLLHIPFVPAGESARMHYNTQQDLLLHSTYNDVHPNLNGSYLVASTMYASLFQEPVTGTTSFNGIPQATATYFHSIADEIVLPNKANWRINTYNLHADFDYQITDTTVTFTNTATNFTTLEWDFGDGNTANILNPVHTFANNGQKTVRLKVMRDNCSEIIEKQIDLNSLVLTDFFRSQITLYPNPAKSQLNITGKVATGIRIFNSIGQKVYSNTTRQLQHEVNLSGFTNGVYFLITDDNQIYKFIKS
ncbi:T9SS type A sorting domain-containing protein [Flavobacterium cerinum]|uniref:PKD domain-containing protein n=1 Tax=Flavobacterium cerinum TaxID=2502784 RepID=A0ABY5IR70_9FLAO|nr:T9SS type A sorting domain-containing protein [Flavobacterium cerinum]UUC45342.1 PKD domain-containing protein [Flavobacterium cerinum]